MKAVDTNILVRLVARDDPAQAEVAEQVLASGDALVLPTVLLEAEWVLRSVYRVPRHLIAQGLLTLLGQPGIITASAAPVAAALTAYGQAGDFADLLHFALATEAGATAFLTFDRTFARSEPDGPELQIL